MVYYGSMQSSSTNEQCPGSGRKWTSGTNAVSSICPFCHRGYRSIVGVDSPRPKRGSIVPNHDQRKA